MQFLGIEFRENYVDISLYEKTNKSLFEYIYLQALKHTEFEINVDLYTFPKCFHLWYARRRLSKVFYKKFRDDFEK